MALLNGKWKTYRLPITETSVIADEKDFIVNATSPSLEFTKADGQPGNSRFNLLSDKGFTVDTDAEHRCQVKVVSAVGDNLIAGFIKKADGTSIDAFVGVKAVNLTDPVFSEGSYEVRSVNVYGQKQVMDEAHLIFHQVTVEETTRWIIVLGLRDGRLMLWEKDPPLGDTLTLTQGNVTVSLRAVEHKEGDASLLVGYASWPGSQRDGGVNPGDADSFVAVRVGPPGDGDGEGEEGR